MYSTNEDLGMRNMGVSCKMVLYTNKTNIHQTKIPFKMPICYIETEF